jgi:hypothetical protein
MINHSRPRVSSHHQAGVPSLFVLAMMIDLGNGSVGIWYESYKRGILTEKTSCGIKLVLNSIINTVGIEII